MNDLGLPMCEDAHDHGDSGATPARRASRWRSTTRCRRRRSSRAIWWCMVGSGVGYNQAAAAFRVADDGARLFVMKIIVTSASFSLIAFTATALVRREHPLEAFVKMTRRGLAAPAWLDARSTSTAIASSTSPAARARGRSFSFTASTIRPGRGSSVVPGADERLARHRHRSRRATARARRQTGPLPMRADGRSARRGHRPRIAGRAGRCSSATRWAAG